MEKDTHTESEGHGVFNDGWLHFCDPELPIGQGEEENPNKLKNKYSTWFLLVCFTSVTFKIK